MGRGERINPRGARAGKKRGTPTAQASRTFLKPPWLKLHASAQQTSVPCTQGWALKPILSPPCFPNPIPTKCPNCMCLGPVPALPSGLHYTHLVGTPPCLPHLSRVHTTKPCYMDPLTPTLTLYPHTETLSSASPVPSSSCAYSLRGGGGGGWWWWSVSSKVSTFAGLAAPQGQEICHSVSLWLPTGGSGPGVECCRHGGARRGKAE